MSNNIYLLWIILDQLTQLFHETFVVCGYKINPRKESNGQDDTKRPRGGLGKQNKKRVGSPRKLPPKFNFHLLSNIMNPKKLP